MTMNVSEIKP